MTFADSVEEQGAARSCIAFLSKLGYTTEQAILLLSAAPVDAHVAAIVE